MNGNHEPSKIPPTKLYLICRLIMSVSFHHLICQEDIKVQEMRVKKNWYYLLQTHTLGYGRERCGKRPVNKEEWCLFKTYRDDSMSESSLNGLSSFPLNVTWKITWLVFAIVFFVLWRWTKKRWLLQYIDYSLIFKHLRY